jgi:hypothetical protein
VSSDAFPSAGVAIGDVDNDQKLDAVFANASNRKNRICFGNGVGGFSSCQDVSGDAFTSTAVALGKVDGDNNLDVVFANTGAVNRVCLGDGDGGFSCGNVNSDAFASNGVALGDVNGDGDLDAVFANFAQKNRVCVGSGLGFFACSNVSSSAFKSTAVALGQLNPPPSANTPPELVPISDQSMEEDATLAVLLSASDPDGDGLSYSTTGLPGFGTLTDNGDGTGSIRFAPKAGEAGSYVTTVFVTDNGTPQKSDGQSFTLEVTEKLVDPAIVVPAVIVPILLD